MLLLCNRSRRTILESRVGPTSTIEIFRLTVRNAEQLRAVRATEADLQHVAEEIEDIGKRNRRELLSRLTVLVVHLLKWMVQPDRRSRSWEATVRSQRRDLKKPLSENPSLRSYLLEAIP
jgi:hypothetical protein